MACLARCVCFVCVPRLSLVGFGGLSAGRGGEGVGGERVGAERGERGRGGRAASRLSGFKTEVGGKKKKISPKTSLALTRSLPLSLTLSLSELRCRRVGAAGGKGGQATVRGPSPGQPTVSHSGKPSQSGGLAERRRRSRARPEGRAGRGGGRRPAEWPERCPGPGESASKWSASGAARRRPGAGPPPPPACAGWRPFAAPCGPPEPPEPPPKPPGRARSRRV